MTASAATLPKKHRTWDLSDLLSPVAVKEMRQIVRSGFVRAAFLALLAIQVMAMGLFLMTDQLNIGSSASSFGRGADLFIILQIILVAVSLLFVPAYTGVRMAMEYSVEHVDLMFIAGMHPWAIMTGKLTAAVALTSILYAACMPFMLLTYLLRGVDIPTILTVLTASYLTTIWATAAILLSNCIRLSRAGRMGIGIALLVGLMIAAGINIAVAYYMVDEGQGMETGTLVFWCQKTVTLLCNLQWVTLVLLLASVALTPTATNRMLPVRAIMTGAWVVTLIPAAVGSIVGGRAGPIFEWAIWQMTVLIMLLTVAVCERREFSRRLLAAIPDSGPRRFGLFVLSTGWAGGMLWCAAAIILTSLMLMVGLLPTDWETQSGFLAFVWSAGFGFHLLAAASLAHLMAGPSITVGFRRPSMAWLLSGAMFAGSSVPIAILLGVLGSATSGSTSDQWLTMGLVYCVVALAALAGAGIPVARRMRRHYGTFRKIDPSLPPPLPATPPLMLVPINVPRAYPPPAAQALPLDQLQAQLGVPQPVAAPPPLVLEPKNPQTAQTQQPPAAQPAPPPPPDRTPDTNGET